MTWTIRTSVLAAGAAALLSAQTAYAAPAMSRATIDPLVSLSVLGSAQSRAAVCAAGANAAAAGAATLAVQGANPCLLPLTGAVPPPVAPAAAPPPVITTDAGKRIGWVPIVIGGIVIAALAWWLLDDDDDDDDLVPISPA